MSSISGGKRRRKGTKGTSGRSKVDLMVLGPRDIKSQTFQTAIVRDAPYYRYNSVLPTAGLASVTLSRNDITPVQFEMPAAVVNYARSYLQFTMNDMADSTAALYNWLCVNAPPIDSISLQTRTGQYLVQLTFCRQYLQMVRPLGTRVTDFMQNTFGESLSPCNDPQGAVGFDGQAGTVAMSEQKYAHCWGANTAGVVNYYLVLGDVFKETFFALPSDTYFRESLILTVNFCSCNNISWSGTDPNDPSVGTQAKTAGTQANTLTNVAFMMAYQSNDQLQNKTIQVMGQSFQIAIPFPINSQAPIAANQVQWSWPITHTAGNGAYLRRMYFSLFNNTGFGSWVHDMDNLTQPLNANAARMIVSFNTTDMGVNIQPQLVSCLMGTPVNYFLMRYWLKGAVSGQNVNHFLKSNIWVDFLDDAQPISAGTPFAREQTVGGWRLDGSNRTWGISATLAGATFPMIAQFISMYSRVLAIGLDGSARVTSL